MALISCIGAANVDIKTRASTKLVLGSSNSVRSFISPGGVARNISENLVRLGATVKLISRVGNDAHGRWLLDSLQKLTLGTGEIGISKNCPTATYTALLEPDGEMLIAIADMAICDEITPKLFKDYHQGILKDSRFIVVDSNLSCETLQYIAIKKPPDAQLWAVAVSAYKTKRLLSMMPHLTGLILNFDELLMLVDKPCETKHGFLIIDQVRQQLSGGGTAALVVTCGKDGVYLATGQQTLFYKTESLSNVEDVTGAGDAFAAGLIFGLERGLVLEQAVVLGLKAARLTLSTKDTVHPRLSMEYLLDHIKPNFYQVVNYR